MTTKEQVIELAKQAGIDDWWESGNERREELDDLLTTFATLVRNAYRAELLAGVGEPAVKLHGKHKNGKLSAERMELYTADQLAAAVLAARNAALEEVANWIEPQRNDIPANGFEFATAIRNLKDKA